MERSQTVEKVDLIELIKDFQIKDLSTFSRYLIEIWKDLAVRSTDGGKGITKLTFSHYYDLPGIISDRLFSVFDKNQNGFLDPKEFIEGMNILFSESFHSLAEFIFKFYDFDHDGYITKEDVRVVLSYVPLQKKFSKNKMLFEQNEYKDRVESQDELFNILKEAFGEKEKLTQGEFINVVENVNSDTFIFILMFLLEKRPFSDETIKVFVLNKEKAERKMNECLTPKVESHHKIASPSLKSKFISPTLKKRTLEVGSKNILSLYSGKAPQPSTFGKKAKNDVKSIGTEPKTTEGDSVFKKKNPHRKLRKMFENFEDPNTFNKSNDFAFGKVNSDSSAKNIDDDDDINETQTPPLVTHEGYMYKITHSKKFKLVYFKLVGKDIYYYSKKEDTAYKGMHNLSGIYINPADPVLIERKKYFTFSILYPKKTRTYYLEKEEEFNEWIKKLHLAINYKSLLDQYEIQNKLGKGKFGLVKLAKHKETGRLVAIKIMAKKNMNSQDLQLAKTEIDILKVAQHPNIIKLYDIYDTSDYIYIVMEYCSGGDLFGYLEKRGFRLPEPRACEIIHKLAMSIFYIHSYGIVHRDLKPENILMTDQSEKADIRLLDFGLGKIIGPTDKCTEPYGTLSYVAPEVLQEKPYDKSVDLWSLGIITYLILCGFLPFDDDNSEREIARQTIQDPVPYPSQIWSKISKEARRFVDGLLRKNPSERMTIKQVLEHEWFKQYSKSPEIRQKTNTRVKSLFSLYTNDDLTTGTNCK